MKIHIPHIYKFRYTHNNNIMYITFENACDTSQYFGHILCSMMPTNARSRSILGNRAIRGDQELPNKLICFVHFCEYTKISQIWQCLLHKPT